MWPQFLFDHGYTCDIIPYCVKVVKKRDSFGQDCPPGNLLDRWKKPTLWA